MQKNNVKCIHFGADFSPYTAELTDALIKAGYRPLSSAVSADMLPGTVVVVYNAFTHRLDLPFVIENRTNDLLYVYPGEMFAKDYNDHKIIANEHEHWNYLYYKVVLYAPYEDKPLRSKMVSKFVNETPFKSLNEATPETLPDGCCALLYKKGEHNFMPILVRTVSTSNRRFLYLQLSDSDEWISKVIMDHLDPLDNYYYIVIS